MQDQDIFINYINDNYSLLKNKYFNYCRENSLDFDEDIYQDTILKCYEAIAKKGFLADTSNQGIENYFFISFKMNIKREGQYARNCKRDMNYTSDNINSLYESWYNANYSDARTKLINDLWKDFVTLYIMHVVEDNFDNEHFYLFRLKYLIPDMTYKKLADKTHLTKVRQKVVDVKNWLKDNLTKDEVKEAFYSVYGDLL